ncbi:hypothetical protein [Streptococcus suis]|uniref:Bacteriocin n=1 Tax=Streptococcus suis TaxID=1307 RepID=A0A116M0K7_STRSU|nr:hypothetical protein [Streptococcus suis]MCQ9223908.1 hypothetical protein [Streptococcus suis]MCQ9230597.1 hypothetical protein [Streptococcus suis]MCR1233578.1 hypothetical protein [Streptococcus suis]MDW8710037.1 hypothetical protein [Streptococcus suis]UUM22757.1 hypothetical protein NQZ84_07225 [Streptococcus suis]
MNKSDNLTMYYPLSTAELKNTIGGNRSDFWEGIFQPRNKIKQ